jgi:hypothetical protein
MPIPVISIVMPLIRPRFSIGVDSLYRLMQAGIPNPKDTPKKRPTMTIIRGFEMLSKSSKKEAAMLKAIQKMIRIARSIFLAREAPAIAEKMSPEKWVPQIKRFEVESSAPAFDNVVTAF